MAKTGKLRIPESGLLTYTIMAVNVVVFLLMEFNGGSKNIYTLLDFGAVQRDFVVKGGQYYRMFTAMFLHIGIEHLAFNSLSLYIFGVRAERYFGKTKFLILYVLSGIAGSALTVLTSSAICAGASGAIFGLIGAILALTQISKGLVDGLNFQSLVALVAVNIIFGILTPNIGNAAHIGGLIAGYALGFLMIKMQLRRSRLRI